MRVSCALLKASTYSAFLVATRGMFRGVPVAVRSQRLGQLYRALPEKSKAKLERLASTMTMKRRRAKPRRLPKRAPHKYARFVAAQHKNPKIKKIKNAPERMRAIAKLWKAKKSASK